jgi:drug/metabolite transporter (DMT)-like permease
VSDSPPGDTDDPGRGVWQTGPLIAVAVTVVLWASAFIGIRYAAPFLSPGPLALLRLAVGTVALGAMALVRRDALPKGRDWWPILAIGVLWFGVYNVSLNAGERLIDAGTASMVINVSPILIALGAAWMLRERLTRWLLVGLAVAFVGSVVVGLASSEGGGSDPLIGVLLCLLAAIVYAVSVLLQKGVLQRVSAIQVTFLACATGLVCTLPFGATLVAELADAPAGVPWAVVYLGLFPTAIAFTTWAYALRSIPAGRLGVTTYVVPVLVVLMSWGMLGEVPPWGAFAGGALCLAGVAVARRR